MAESFKIPAGAQPFTPGSIVPEKQGMEHMTLAPDMSRTVSGLASNLKQQTPDVMQGPEIGKAVDLSGEPKVEDKPEPIVVCPGCGATISDPSEIVPSEESKTVWLRHILGEPRFTQVFSLFGDKVSVSFRSRTMAENEAIYNQITAEVKSGEIETYGGIMSPAYYARMNRLMLLCSLQAVEYLNTGSVKVVDYPEVTEAAYPKAASDDVMPLLVRAYNKVLGANTLPEGLVAAISTSHRRFEALIAVLTRHSGDPDFWQPTGKGT